MHLQQLSFIYFYFWFLHFVLDIYISELFRSNKTWLSESFLLLSRHELLLLEHILFFFNDFIFLYNYQFWFSLSSSLLWLLSLLLLLLLFLYCYYHYYFMIFNASNFYCSIFLSFYFISMYEPNIFNFKTYDVAKHCSKLAIMTLRLYESCSFGVFDGNFEQCLFDLFFWRSSFEVLLYFAHSQLVLLFFKYFLI